MISVRDLTFSYAKEPILERVNFSVEKNSIAGLVGPNGAGKSTLFHLLMGGLEPDSGQVRVHGSIGYVPQEVKTDPLLDGAETIQSYIDPENRQRPYQLGQILAGLGLGKLELTRPPQQLSGGQKTRLALARQLIAEPQTLLLDEPTNFLDSDGKAWVMEFLARYPHAILLVSHDLELLDQHIKKVLLINPLTKQVETYRGNHSAYLKLKGEREKQLHTEIKKQQDQVKSLETGLKRMKFKSGSGVRRRVVQQRRVARLKQNLPELPTGARSIKVDLPTPAWVGSRVLECRGISKKFGTTQILNNVSFELKRGQIMSLVGANGAGKSTLIKIIMGALEPDRGEVEIHPDAKIGYYSQEFENFDQGQSLLETVMEEGDISQGQARGLLGKFMFSGGRVNQKIHTLSGGEKTRLAIARLLLKDYNLLILDEPTTYLDVLSQRAILEGLKKYRGTMIVVSHTPDFIKELTPAQALLLPEERFTHWRDELLDRVAAT